MGKQILQVFGVCGAATAVILIIFLLTGRWSAARLKNRVALSIVALGCAWVLYSLSKGRLGILPLAYAGFGLSLFLNRQESRRFVVFLLNLFAAGGACLFLAVYAYFGGTLDGPIINPAERWWVTALCLWGIINTGVLLRVGQLDGSLPELVQKGLKPKMVFRIVAGVILAICLAILCLIAIVWGLASHRW
jgi:hypothetical protein